MGSTTSLRRGATRLQFLTQLLLSPPPNHWRQVLLFPNDTTFTPEGQEPVEVLKGNVKTTLAVTGW